MLVESEPAVSGRGTSAETDPIPSSPLQGHCWRLKIPGCKLLAEVPRLPVAFTVRGGASCSWKLYLFTLEDPS